MQHEHLNFYSHSSVNKNGLSSFKMGGAELLPALNIPGGPVQQSEPQRNFSGVEKHIQIVEYLRSLPPKSRVYFC